MNSLTGIVKDTDHKGEYQTENVQFLKEEPFAFERAARLQAGDITAYFVSLFLFQGTFSQLSIK